MSRINSLTLLVDDPTEARRFYAEAFGLGPVLQFEAASEPVSGFRGFTLSLVVDRPATVDSFIESAVRAGATALKPPRKTMWGYGGTVQAPDGSVWQSSTSNKKDGGPATREVDQFVLLLGVEDVKASKELYVERGLTVAKSFGRKYAEFALADSPVKLGLYGRRSLAKTAGVDPEGSGSHRLRIDGDLGAFTDADGFTWGVRVPAMAV